MATVNPQYFDWGSRIQEGFQQGRELNRQQIERQQADEDRVMRINAQKEAQQAQSQKNQYEQHIRESQTLFNVAKALKNVQPERRRQTLESWGQRNPIVGNALKQIPPDTDLSDQSLDEFSAGMGAVLQQYQAPQVNSDFLRALDIIRNPNASPQERAAAEVALGLKARAIETRPAPRIIEGVDPSTGQPTFEVVDPASGQKPTIKPTPDTRATQTTEAERKAAGFYDRMLNAAEILNAMEDKGYTPSTRDLYTAGQGVANIVATPEGQNYRQAQENWVRANLRKESGAVIGEDEMKSEISNYFPQIGDKPDVIKQKRANRAIVEKNMLREAGRAYQPASKQQPEQRPNQPTVSNW